MQIDGRGFLLRAALLASLTAAPALADETMTILTNGANIGSAVMTQKGNTVDIDYRVDDNGRGPKHKEHLVFDAAGIPTFWSIDGTTLMGGAVHESMEWKDGRQSWKSQADAGSVRCAAERLYIANDASPYALGIYAQALLKSSDGSLNVLPRGTLRLTKVRDVSVGDGADKITVGAYMLSGIDMTPDILLLDASHRLFAVLGDDVTVRHGYEKYYKNLKALSEALSLARLKQLQVQTAHRYDMPVRIRNVHVFDPKTMKMSPLRSVVIYRGRITTVEAPLKDPPKDEAIIDGKGGYMVAGLHDIHAHIQPWDGPLIVAGGITTIRDMGNDNTALPKLMQEIDDGELIGPHVIPSGFIEGKSPYSAQTGIVVATLEEGLRAVHWYADRGYIQIKIYNSAKPEWMKPLADEAKKLGLRVVGHVPAFATADQAIVAGYNEITHVNQLMLGWLLKPGEDTRTPLRLTAMARAADLDLNSEKVQHTLHLMLDHNVGWDTTISIVEQLMMSRAGEVPENAAAYLDHMPIGVQRYKRRSYVNFKDKAEEDRYARAFQKSLDTMALFYKHGVRLWPGTDASNGFTLHRELELYAKIGIPAAKVLRIDTYDADVYLKRDQLYGSIARGKAADFFLTVDDPSRDISALHRMPMVVKDGVVYFPGEIYRAYGITPFADALSVVLPKSSSNGETK